LLIADWRLLIWRLPIWRLPIWGLPIGDCRLGIADQRLAIRQYGMTGSPS
jgi:hypothetical protein